MFGWLAALGSLAVVYWLMDPFGGGITCERVLYPVSCAGWVSKGECNGTLGGPLPRRKFLVTEDGKRVLERAGERETLFRNCLVTDCRNWKCMDEVFVRTMTEGEYRELIRPDLKSLTPPKTDAVFVPAWTWWRLVATEAALRAATPLLNAAGIS